MTIKDTGKRWHDYTTEVFDTDKDPFSLPAVFYAIDGAISKIRCIAIVQCLCSACNNMADASAEAFFLLRVVLPYLARDRCLDTVVSYARAQLHDVRLVPWDRVCYMLLEQLECESTHIKELFAYPIRSWLDEQEELSINRRMRLEWMA